MKAVACVGAVLALSVAGLSAAQAAKVETKGGIKVKSDDGLYEAQIGGRVHFDANLIDTDDEAVFGSAGTENDGFFFRRIYLTFKGKANGWKYKVEADFAPSNSSGSSRNSFQEVYLGRKLGPGEIYFGQLRPYRGMEELTSSNEVVMIERPFASSSFMFGGGSSRTFQLGVFYKGNWMERGTYGVSGFSLRQENTPSTPGLGGNARITYAPELSSGAVIHFGASYSYENPDGQNNDDTAGDIGSRAGYGGRRGPSITLGTTSQMDTAQTVGGELAGRFGSFYVQAEYMTQELGQGDVAADQTVDAYYVQTSYLLTGETKPYNLKKGNFGSPKPRRESGAWELTARYDFAENSDAANQPEAEALTVGVNWYVNSSVRFMLNYVDGSAEQIIGGSVQSDEPQSIMARAQLSF